MAESSCSEMSNNQNNTQTASSVVQRINQTENCGDKTDDKVKMIVEPILLEDYKYGQTPQTVLNLLEFFQAQEIVPDKYDILAGFVRILMLESGFIDVENADTYNSDFNYQKLLALSKHIPNSDWKRIAGSYRFNFVLKSGPQYPCAISCMTSGDDFLVNCCIARNFESFSVILDPLSYIASSLMAVGKFMFQNLNSLSRVFKNEIANPAKIAIIVKSGGICTGAYLPDLPQEVLLKIVSYLGIRDVMELAKTCRFLCILVNDACLWTKLLDWDFRKRNIRKRYDELKFLYEIKYGRELAKILHNGP